MLYALDGLFAGAVLALVVGSVATALAWRALDGVASAPVRALVSCLAALGVVAPSALLCGLWTRGERDDPYVVVGAVIAGAAIEALAFPVILAASRLARRA